jgi:Gnt-I system low-affinity gluconate transporter
VEQSVASGLPAGLDAPARKEALHEALVNGPGWKGALVFLGNPITALLLATILSLFFLGLARGTSSQKLLHLSTKALAPAGLIILITGAGGVFKEVLKQTGVADALKLAFEGSALTPLMLGYVFAAVIRIAQGSATVAMLTAGGLLAGLGGNLPESYLSFCVVGIAAGASGFSHVNDSGFWIVSRYFGLTEKETLRTWTLLSTAVSLVGFALCLLGSFLWCGRF